MPVSLPQRAHWGQVIFPCLALGPISIGLSLAALESRRTPEL
jgi:hypothetical protein